MKRITALVIAFLLAMPAVASAHAAPVESQPRISESIQSVPQEVLIRFSERIDAAASAIEVKDPSGKLVSTGVHLSKNDARTLVASIHAEASGTYTVSWSVVSSDDGHFTRGRYAFAVGSGALVDPSLASATEIVQISTLPEVAGMTVELVSHGILWAILVLFAFGVRALVRSGLAVDEILVARAYRLSAFSAALLAICGAAYQILVKAQDLAGLHGIGLVDAIPMYLATVAGSATLFRVAAVFTYAIVAAVFASAIVRSRRLTWQEGVLFLSLCVFAFFRAKISHATANHFHPDFSVAVNFVHLIEKDIWAGILIVLTLAFVLPRTRSIFYALWKRASVMLAINVGALTVTGSYIVWLHLKDPVNLFSTKWGLAFLTLFVVAVLLVLMRVGVVVAGKYRFALLSKSIAVALAVELVLAITVVFQSSAVIITSPPVEEVPTPVYSAKSEGMRITLGRYLYEDGLAVLKIDGGMPTEEPFVTIGAEDEAGGEVQLSEKYPGTYTFPLSFLAAGRHTVSIRVPQAHAYDAVAEFQVPTGAYTMTTYELGTRQLDLFSLAMIAIAIGGALLSFVLYRIALASEELPRARGRYHDVIFILSALLTTLMVLAVLYVLHASVIKNKYQALCESDGNMWHMMLPTKAGIQLSSTPREGCMWGMGAYQYMFPEQAEYEYLRALPPVTASLDFTADPVAGVPTEFTVSVKDAEGSPAKLFVDMEKLVHVVIVSRDQRTFAHVHPDDTRPLTEEEIETSTFRFSYTFPTSGDYLMSIDFANGITLGSSQHEVHVSGAPAQASETAIYASPARVGDLEVTASYSQPLAGEVSTLVYQIKKGGIPVELTPYLSAAMHIAVVKNDFTAFAHMHGEIHPAGVAVAPVIVKDGKIVHSMAAMASPPVFSSPIDAHVIFPEPGLYTIWGQFRYQGSVYSLPLTVRVE